MPQVSCAITFMQWLENDLTTIFCDVSPQVPVILDKKFYILLHVTCMYLHIQLVYPKGHAIYLSFHEID